MTPEEKFIKDAWYVLQEIKKKSLYSEDNKSISYKINLNDIASGLPLAEEEIAILKKLQQRQIIKILNKKGVLNDYGLESGTIYFLEILQPKFNELYRLYERRANPISIKNPNDLKTWVQIAQVEERINKELKELTNAEKKKLCVLEKLKEEYDLTPKTLVRTHIYFGYSYVRPAGEAILYGKKLLTWLQECNLNDRLELENILAIFQQEGLVSKFIYSEQEGNLKIQFPEEFEKRYNEYRDIFENQRESRNGEKEDAVFIEKIREQGIEEIKRRQELFKKLGEQITSSFKYIPIKEINEYSRKITEHITPIRELMQSVNMAQEAVKTPLFYSFQNLAPFLKQLDEQMEGLRKIIEVPAHSSSKAIVSPEVLQTKIEAQQISELKNIGTLLQRLLDGNRKEPLKDKHTLQEENLAPDIFTVSVKDREIWVNNWLISKPHAVGSNFEFFDYIRSKPPNTKINRETLPNFGGNLSLKEQVRSKSFIKIATELGFKGEMLKAFFYNRGKDTLTYRGDKITKENLKNAGIKTSLFLKELELAHTRNSPE